MYTAVIASCFVSVGRIYGSSKWSDNISSISTNLAKQKVRKFQNYCPHVHVINSECFLFHLQLHLIFIYTMFMFATQSWYKTVGHVVYVFCFVFFRKPHVMLCLCTRYVLLHGKTRRSENFGWWGESDWSRERHAFRNAVLRDARHPLHHLQTNRTRHARAAHGHSKAQPTDQEQKAAASDVGHDDGDDDDAVGAYRWSCRSGAVDVRARSTIDVTWLDCWQGSSYGGRQTVWWWLDRCNT